MVHNLKISRKKNLDVRKEVPGVICFSFFLFFTLGRCLKCNRRWLQPPGGQLTKVCTQTQNSNASIIVHKLCLIPQSHGHKNTICRLTFSLRKLITGQQCRVSRKLSDNDFAAISASAALICCFKAFL